MISLDNNRFIAPGAAPLAPSEKRCGAKGYIRIYHGGLTELFNSYISLARPDQEGRKICLNRGSLIDYLNAYNQSQGIKETYSKGLFGFCGTSDDTLEKKYLEIIGKAKEENQDRSKEERRPFLEASVQLCAVKFFDGKPDVENFTPIQAFYESPENLKKPAAVQVWTQTIDDELIVRIDVRDAKHLNDHLSKLLSNKDFIAKMSGKEVKIHVNSQNQKMSQSIVGEIRKWQRSMRTHGVYIASFSAPVTNSESVKPKEPESGSDGKRLTPNRFLLDAEVKLYERKKEDGFVPFQTFPRNDKASESEPEIRILTRKLPNRDLILRIDIGQYDGELRNLRGILDTIVRNDRLIEASLTSRKMIICVNAETREQDKKIVPLIQTWQRGALAKKERRSE